jgi:cardiolipin synthase A/B
MVAKAGEFGQLAELALAIDDASGLEEVCTALESRRLNHGSTSVARASVASGSAIVERHLRSLQDAWMAVAPDLSGEGLALVLRTSVAAVAIVRERAPITQVVWSGPTVDGSFVRATREIVRELLRAAQREILVVGYWIAARDEGEGIIEEFIASLADAVSRGVSVNVIVDERIREDRRDNRRILVSAWPAGVMLPKIVTWRLPSGDQHLKLHAKILVADRRDALVTSANLTSYAMDRNMEMGVRIVGYPAEDIARHFDLLEAQGILEPYGDERSKL